MLQHSENNDNSPGLRDIDQNRRNKKGLYRIIDRVQPENILYVMSGMSQLAAGILLVYIPILGVIEKTWLAALLSGVGSVVTMLGAYMLYDQLRNRFSVDYLVRDSINRAINCQN
jgi:hypothetical protein